MTGGEPAGHQDQLPGSLAMGLLPLRKAATATTAAMPAVAFLSIHPCPLLPPLPTVVSIPPPLPLSYVSMSSLCLWAELIPKCGPERSRVMGSRNEVWTLHLSGCCPSFAIKLTFSPKSHSGWNLPAAPNRCKKEANLEVSQSGFLTWLNCRIAERWGWKGPQGVT